MKVVKRITLEEVRAATPKTIYYGAQTCWWTHDPSHLGRTPEKSEAEVLRIADNLRLNSSTPAAPLDSFLERARRAAGISLPADPRGGVLYQTDDVEGFLKAAEESRTFYGRHGLDAFLAAHHLNCVVSDTDPRPWCAQSWEEYNAALDELHQSEENPNVPG